MMSFRLATERFADGINLHQAICRFKNIEHHLGTFLLSRSQAAERLHQSHFASRYGCAIYLNTLRILSSHVFSKAGNDFEIILAQASRGRAKSHPAKKAPGYWRVNAPAHHAAHR